MKPKPKTIDEILNDEDFKLAPFYIRSELNSHYQNLLDTLGRDMEQREKKYLRKWRVRVHFEVDVISPEAYKSKQ